MCCERPDRGCRAPRHAHRQVARARHARRDGAEDRRGVQRAKHHCAQHALGRREDVGGSAKRALQGDCGRRHERRREQTRNAEQKGSVELSLRRARAPHAGCECAKRGCVEDHSPPIGRDFRLDDARVQQLLGDQRGNVDGRAGLECAEDCRRSADADKSQSQRPEQQDHRCGHAKGGCANGADAAFGEEHARENGDDRARCGGKNALNAEEIQRCV